MGEQNDCSELTKEEELLIRTIRQKPFQTVTAKVQDGVIVHISIEEKIKVK